MIKSCVTIALVSEIKTGPWIFWNDLEKSMSKASNLGFDAIELFTSSGEAIDTKQLKFLLDKFNLELAAVGTGAGKVIHGLTLTDPDENVRKKAISFISKMIDFGSSFGAPAIIGSMQGNASGDIVREQALAWLAEGLQILGKEAAEKNVILIYEPLNRYETNLINTLDAGVEFIESKKINNVKLLADLFHMNIEEPVMTESIRKHASHIGHVHFADSNRRPVGSGHTDMQSIALTIKEIGYDGFISAEAFPWPNEDAAATQTITSFNKFFRN
jgi:sugar phosphate isomerase/epimerase